jgi:glycosyltransferase involved in cell wall biosynthesis
MVHPCPEVSLALPCYNERAGIADVIRMSIASLGRLGQPWELLVIDNCSRDGTPDAVRPFTADPRVRLIVHETNRFYSGSCQTALEQARGRYVAFMDSDGQFTADDLPRFLEALHGGANLVFGWRKHRHDPLSRKAASAVFNFLARAMLGFGFHDLNVGLRMFDRKFRACAAPLRHRLNLANPELFVRARLAGLKIAEVPVTHSPRLAGRSCHDMVRMWGLFRLVWRYFRDLRAELRDPSTRPAVPAASTPRNAKRRAG